VKLTKKLIKGAAMIFNKLKDIFTTIIYIIFCAFILFNTSYFILAKPLKPYLGSHGKLYSLLFIIASSIFAIAIVLAFKKLLFRIKLDRQWPALMILILTTAVPRLIWIAIIKVKPLNDFNTYHAFATAFSKGNFIGGGYIALFPHYVGYPILLAPFYMLFGTSTNVANTLNVVLSCGISLLLYFIGSKLFDRKCGLGAAFIWALWPSQIFYTALVSTEIIFTFLMLLCLSFFLFIMSSNKGPLSTAARCLLLGVLCSITNVIRPIGLVVFIAIFIYFLIFITDKVKIKNSKLTKVVFLTLLVASYLISSKSISISTSNLINEEVAKYPFGFNIYVGSNYETNGAWNAADAKALIEIEKKPGITPHGVHNELLKLSVERIRSRSIFKTLSFFYNKHGMIWPVDHDSLVYIKSGLIQEHTKLDFYKFERFLIKLSNFYYHAILLLCGFGGFILLKRKNQGLPLLLVIIILGIISLHMIMEVAGRYHFPAICLFSLLASYGISSFFKQGQPKLS
jgi:hypothetical protein